MSRFYPWFKILIALALPFFLIMTAVRLTFSPLYLNYEYNKAGFPSDSYGFTTADRLKWGQISMDYLFNNADISFLGNLRLPDGQSLYNERELSHMLDVKILVQKMLSVWYVVIAALLVMGVWAWRSSWLDEFFQAVGWGGWLTIGLMAAVLVAVFTNFSSLFTQFHHLFFTGDSWLFLYSDSLIRLFPMPLWEDGFILVGGITLLGAIISVVLGKKLGG